MHAEIRHLIALRDGEPVDAAAAGHVRDCGQCWQALAELNEARDALRALPTRSPPAEAWARIAREWEREKAPRVSRRVALFAVFVAALTAVVFRLAPKESAVPDMEPQAIVVSTVELQQRSRELEYLLKRYESPGVMSLRTAGAISELEDSIAMIDYLLNAASGESRERELWRQRIELMETLVTVHAAEQFPDGI